MRFIGLVLCLLLIPLFAFGQDNNEEYRYRSYQEDDFRPINVDTSLLLAPLGRVPLFDALARYNFSFVPHARRGIDPGRHKYWLGDREIVFNDGYPDFSLLGVLRESTTSWMVYAYDALHGTPVETRSDIVPSA